MSKICVCTHTREKTDNNYANDIRKKVFNVRKNMLVFKVLANLYIFIHNYLLRIS